MSDRTLLDEVRILVNNLGSLWNGGREVLDLLVNAGGEPKLSPAGVIRRLGPEATIRLLAGHEDEVHQAFQTLTRYLAGDTWFDRAVGASYPNLEALRNHPIAYFCMEYGVANWFPIYSGGLGILAGDVLKEASDMGLPMVAVGLLYRRGFFYQKLDENNYQTELIPDLDPATLPLEPAVDAQGRELVLSLPIGDHAVYARVWKMQVGKVPLYLLDTDTPENTREEDRRITASLYGGATDTRIQQEMVLGIGGMRALERLGIEASVFSMNEGHAAFLGLELMAEQMRSGDLDCALERARERVVYTNHTVVAAGNDVFPRDLIYRYLGQYAQETGIGIDRVVDLATSGPEDGFSMARLAFQISGKANGVSVLHAEVLRKEWPEFDIEAVTNGVHIPTWLGVEMRALLDEFIPDWQADEVGWDAIKRIPHDRLQAAHDAQRRRFIEFVNHRQNRVRLDESALTIVWARRFAEYKRAWLIASDLERLARIVGDSDHPVQIVIAGKSHPRDEGGKHMLQALLNRLRENPVVDAQVAFVEDYDEQVARYLTMGADVWLNTPRKPLEASGTSGMKASDNGCLQLTITDGWAAEVDWWGTGWGVAGNDDASDGQQIYEYLEDSIVPRFYQRNQDGLAEGWLTMMQNTMLITLSRYSTRRMLLDYLDKLYLPLVGESEAVGSRLQAS